MTDTAFYDRMDALASRLLDKFGSSSTLRRITVTAPDAQGGVVQSPPTDFPGLAVQTTQKELVDRLVSGFEAAYVVKFATKPVQGDVIIFAGSNWKVRDAAYVSPEGSRLIITIVGTDKL